MKFLIIAYSDADGVGQHVISLNKNLNNMGHESKTVLLHKSEDDKNIILIGRSIFHRLLFFFLEFIKIDLKKLFSFGNSTIKFKKIEPYIKEAEVIIIYTLHKIVSFNMLKKIFDTKKVVYIRALDMEFASGGCHVNTLRNGNECLKFESGCNNCPLLNKLNIFNLSKKIFIKKKKIIEKYKPKIFLENNFTKKIYDKSPITKNSKTETIFLGVNKNRTNFISKTESRKNLNLEQNEKIILFGTFNLDAPHKGGRLLGSILQKLITILKNKNYLESSKIRLLTFGRKNTFNINIPNLEWTNLGIINSDKKLNNLYRASDVFVSPSTGCNGPHVVLEALLNDLPVVGFNQGVAQDSIINGINGYLVPCFNHDIFADSVYKSIFLNEFDFDNEKNKKLKYIFNSSFEAKSIIKHAENDFKNNV